MVFRAIRFAADAHEGHYRKGTTIPYISHLMNVMKILCENGCEEEIIVAGILHDVVEDTPTTIETVERKFGKRVAAVVAGASEPEKTAKDAQWESSWKARKQHTIDYLGAEADLVKLLVSCADKLDNARAILSDQQESGDGVWIRFNAGREDQKWYYQSLAKVFLMRGEAYGNPLLKMARELDRTVSHLFRVEAAMPVA